MSDLVVVDDFYSDPEKVRQFALLNSTWLEQGALEPDFAGTESRQCFYSDPIVERLRRLVGHDIDYDPRSFAFGAFAVASVRDQGRRHVHLDPAEYTALIYLTPDQLCRGGTTMYRHRATGLSGLPDADFAQRAGHSSPSAYYKAVIEPDARNHKAWDEDISVEMKFNRLLIFKAGSMFHCADSYFGNTISDSRLLQIFFFNRKSS